MTANQLMAERIAKTLARKVFHERGNHSEAHISEAELSGLLQVAALTMARTHTDFERELAL